MTKVEILLVVFMTKCVAVNIKNLQVPQLVPSDSEAIILDCDYSIAASATGLVVKWFFNERNLVYQWIPPMKPQCIGILKDKIDKNYTSSDDPLKAYRAIKIIKPTTDLSGNYTCVVSTFTEEDRRTASMLVYSTGRHFEFYQEKKYVFLVTLICVAEDLYPKPEVNILSQHGEIIKQAVTKVSMDSYGLYSVRTTALVHDDEVTSSFEEFICDITLPGTNITRRTSTFYYPGLMPTVQVSAAGIAAKAQESPQSTNEAHLLEQLDYRLFKIILSLRLFSLYV